MEKQYDIRFNNPEPSSEDIAAHQDFDALLAAFEESAPQQEAVIRPIGQSSGRKRRWLYAAAAAIVFLLASIPMLRNGLGSSLPNEAEFFAERPFVDPPATANVPDLVADLVVDPEKDQTVQLADGQLVLSSSALFRDYGKSIGKPVQVHYRQLDEVADYFLSGLPLSYIESEEHTQLDAAVILDVYATAAGQPVKIAAGETVPVELNTTINNEGEDYRLFQLDPDSRRWVDAGPLKDKQIGKAAGWPEDMEAVKTYRKLEAAFDQKIAAAEQAANRQLPERPTPPQRKAGNNPTLELDFLKQVSLASGSNVSANDLDEINSEGIWELLPETGDVDMRAFNVEWQSVRLRKMPSEKFELTLINPQRQEKLIVRPILLDDGNFQEAQDRYEAELAAYQTAVAAANGNQSDQLKQLLADRDNQLSAAEADILASVEAMSYEEQQRLQNRRANFRFAISSWGIYAVARKIKDLPSMTSVDFSGEEQLLDKDNNRVYLTDGKHKTLYRGLVRNGDTKLPLSEDVQDIDNSRVWLVNESGKLILTEPKIKQGKGIQLTTSKAEPLPSSAPLLRQRLILE